MSAYSDKIVPESTNSYRLKFISLNNYKPIELIASGNFGDVWKAMDNNNNIVAIKILNANENYSGLGHNTINEIAYVTSLDNPNIIKYLAVIIPGNNSNVNDKWDDIFDEYIGIVMELADMSFKQLITSNSDYVKKNFVTLSIQIVDGVNYITNHNIIHRDIKPDNILYMNETSVKIADFGSAITGECYNTNMNLVGFTLKYTPPEILIHNYKSRYSQATKDSMDGTEIKYNGKVDVWALGCVLYEMRTGKELFGTFNAPGNSLDSEDMLLVDMVNIFGKPNNANSEFYKQYTDWTKIVKPIFKYDDNPIDQIDGFDYDKDLRDLLYKIFVIDPVSRISIHDVSKHKLFSRNIRIKPPESQIYTNLSYIKCVSSCETSALTKNQQGIFAWSRSTLFDRKLIFSQLLGNNIFNESIKWLIYEINYYKLNGKKEIFFSTIQLVYRYVTELKKINNT